MVHNLEIKKNGIIFAVYLNNAFLIEFENKTEAIVFCKNLIEAIGGVKFNDLSN